MGTIMILIAGDGGICVGSLVWTCEDVKAGADRSTCILVVHGRRYVACGLPPLDSEVI